MCGVEVLSMTPLSGGDVADSFQVELRNGRRVFAKTKRDAPARFFSTEAAGLRWLGAVEALPVATVIAYTDDHPACLVLEWIEAGGTRTPEGCLLYTSPSPRDRTRSRMPSSA